MESLITIYDKLGKEFLEVPITRECTRKKVLMGDNYVLLVFNHDSYVDFSKGSYIMYKGFKFEIMTDVYPERNKGGWKYSLQFDAKDGLLRKYNIFYRKQGVEEVVFALTTNLLSFGNVICDCINHELGGTNWRIKDIPEEFSEAIKTLSFKGEKLFDALTMMAEQFECEWWIEENGNFVDICFGKLLFGTEEEFKEGEVVKSIPRKAGNDSDFGTRFFVFGSTRNLTSDYGQVEQGGATNHVSEIHLRLPDGMNYIDAWENLAPEDVVQQIAFFDDIYPKNTDIITKVETIDRPMEGGGAFKAYVITAIDTPFLPSDMIEGETLGCVFETGTLQGRSFELSINYDPETWKPSDGFDKKFEIIHVNEGEIIIPNESFKPAVDDKFIITGVKLPEARVKEAEQELLKVGQAWAKKKSQDASVYDCPTNPVFCQLNGKDYDLGQKVRLVGDRFGTNGRSSKIQSFEKKLWNEYEATYTVGDNSQYSRLSAIEGEIKDSQYSERIGVVKGTGIYLIRDQFDSTQPTNYNTYSALASLKKFVPYVGFVDQPVRTTDDVRFKSLIANYLKSIDFASGLTGFKVGADTEVETLKVRKQLWAEEYILNQISLIGDEVILTEGGQIDTVEMIEGGYYNVRLSENSVRAGELKVGDICVTDFKLETGFRRIKFEITKVNDNNSIEVYPEDPAYPPMPLMTFKRVGNFTDETRQNSIRLSSHDQIIEMLSNVNSYSPTWKNRDILIGKIKDLIPEIKGLPESARQKATFFGQNMVLLGNIFQVSADGVTQERVPCYKGTWNIEKAPFFYYDQITDGYVRYTCLYEGEEGTMEEPRFDSDVWQVTDGDTTLSMKMYSSTGSFDFWDRLDILFDASVTVFAGSKPVNDLVNEWEWWLDTGDAEFDAAWKSLYGSTTDTQHVDGTTFPPDMKPGAPVQLWCNTKIYYKGRMSSKNGYLNLN